VEECNYYKGTQPPSAVSHFNLHGLWPNAMKKEDQPFECDDSQKFHYDDFSESLRDQLELKWNGLYNPTKSFLDHEWSKHGTCWNPDDEIRTPTSSLIARLLTQTNEPKARIDIQTAYVKRSLHLADHVNIHKILKSNGIVPREETYPLIDVRKAVQEEFGIKNLVIRCATVKDSEGKKLKLLLEVRVCLGLDYRVEDCPTHLLAQNDCGKDEKIKVFYQPFPFEEMKGK